jgi:hypothetical protein
MNTDCQNSSTSCKRSDSTSSRISDLSMNEYQQNPSNSSLPSHFDGTIEHQSKDFDHQPEILEQNLPLSDELKSTTMDQPIDQSNKLLVKSRVKSALKVLLEHRIAFVERLLEGRVERVWGEHFEKKSCIQPLKNLMFQKCNTIEKDICEYNRGYSSDSEIDTSLKKKAECEVRIELFYFYFILQY